MSSQCTSSCNGLIHVHSSKSISSTLFDMSKGVLGLGYVWAVLPFSEEVRSKPLSERATQTLVSAGMVPLALASSVAFTFFSGVAYGAEKALYLTTNFLSETGKKVEEMKASLEQQAQIEREFKPTLDQLKALSEALAPILSRLQQHPEKDAVAKALKDLEYVHRYLEEVKDTPTEENLKLAIELAETMVEQFSRHAQLIARIENLRAQIALRQQKLTHLQGALNTISSHEKLQYAFLPEDAAVLALKIDQQRRTNEQPVRSSIVIS